MKVKLPRNDYTWYLMLAGCFLFWVGVAAAAGLVVTAAW